MSCKRCCCPPASNKLQQTKSSYSVSRAFVFQLIFTVASSDIHSKFVTHILAGQRGHAVKHDCASIDSINLGLLPGKEDVSLIDDHTVKPSLLDEIGTVTCKFDANTLAEPGTGRT